MGETKNFTEAIWERYCGEYVRIGLKRGIKQADLIRYPEFGKEFDVDSNDDRIDGKCEAQFRTEISGRIDNTGENWVLLVCDGTYLESPYKEVPACEYMIPTDNIAYVYSAES